MALIHPLRAACLLPQHQKCPVSCPASSTRARSRQVCKASASGEGTAGKLPFVDDAISLPPPATGSQYQWRRNWGGSSAAAGGGGNGGSGRSSQARTREWGRGPDSGLLFVILYRMRLLLLYGVWVTVLYGAFRAVVDVTTAAGKAGYSLINKAAELLYGGSALSRSGGGGASGDAAGDSIGNVGADGQDTVLAAAAAAAAAAGALDGSAVSFTEHTSADHAAAGTPLSDSAEQQAGTASSTSSSSFPGLKNRPTATVFSNMMSAVIPLYLMLLGSVVFFASM